MRPRILHITPWFPQQGDETKGIFIANHIESLAPHVTNHILHLQFGDKKKREENTDYNGIPLDRFTLNPPSKKWRAKEIAAALFITRYIRKNKEKYDLVNFTIAYPNAIAINRLKKRFTSLKFTITEHWSAYHYNFNLPEDSNGRKRIAKIFSTLPPLFVVSSALGEDIKRFAKQPQLNYTIIPNSIDTSIFHFKAKKPTSPFIFCSINNWSKLKNPLVLIDAFCELIKKQPNCKLIFAGDGIMLPAMKAAVTELNLEHCVEFRGKLSKLDVANLLQQAHCYCQSSLYETFSAICVEALLCGTPVIASDVGGMKDHINATNGIVVKNKTPQAWCSAMHQLIENYTTYNSANFAAQLIDKYNSNKIGELYANALKKQLDL